MAPQQGRSLEFEIYVPTTDNAGQRYPADLISKFKGALTEEFGGVTDTNHKNKGIWRVNGVEFRDEIVVWRVFSNDPAKLDFLRQLKQEMETDLKQERILCILREVQML